MIPIRQTNPNGRGNCMAACWASILEVSIDTVPDYRAIEAAGGNWMNAVSTWLSKHYGLVYVELEPYVTRAVQPTDWHLISYGRREVGHSIVGCCGRPVFDPATGFAVDHWLRAEPYSFGLLVDLDEDLRATWRPTWGECLCPACIRPT